MSFWELLYIQRQRRVKESLRCGASCLIFAPAFPALAPALMPNCARLYA